MLSSRDGSANLKLDGVPGLLQLFNLNASNAESEMEVITLVNGRNSRSFS